MTKTVAPSIKDALNKGILTELADAFRLMGLGNMLAPLKRTFTGLTSAAAQVLTTIDATGETVGVSNANRLAALSVTALRVTAGAATAGARVVTDAGGAAGAPGANGPGIALLSDDGTTVTFEAAVTGFVIEYIPRSLVDITTIPTGSGMEFAP